MKRAVNPSTLQRIRSGAVEKREHHAPLKQQVIQHKGGKFTVTETKKKVETAGVEKKKQNYVMYKSKLGTEKTQNLTMLQPAVKPRKDEKIVQTKKKVEYLDNYQYHETKDIKNKDPKKVSVVTHKRKGDIVGGSYETLTYNKTTTTNTGKGKLYSSQTSKVTTKKFAPSKPAPGRSNTASRTLPAKSQSYRKELKKISAAPKKPAINAKTTTKTTTTKTTTKTTTTKSNKPAFRAHSAGKFRRH